MKLGIFGRGGDRLFYGWDDGRLDVVHKDSNGDVMAVLGQREDFDENGKMEDIWDTLIEIPDPDTLRGMQKRCGTLHGAWLNLWENIARVLK